MNAEQLINQYGFWGAHPDHPRNLWKLAVANDDTIIGYWEWVANRIQTEGEREDETCSKKRSAQFSIGDIVASNVNHTAPDARYRIVKMNKTTCWVELIGGHKVMRGGKVVEERVLYKNVRYSVLKRVTNT